MASVYDGTTYHSDDSDLIDPQERQGYVSNVLTQATRFIEEELSPDRAEATDYYMGRSFGNEEEGRSRVVSTDVRDAVQSIMPSLLRVFFGPERARAIGVDSEELQKLLASAVVVGESMFAAATASL